MAETIATIRYRAFLSYSHRDTAWGKWLHSALEGYRIDKDLVGRATPVGPVPKTLRPIFRDREDFSAGHSLTEQTLAALEASQFLIVICSPNAAQSKYVNEEIRRFKALGRGNNVIPIIVDGEPGDPARECFPPALRFKLGPDGQLTDEREEPIAADAREQGDGKEIAKQKVVAGLLGLGLDEIVRRAERARKRRNRFWAALAGVFSLLAIAATGSTAYAWQQLKTNNALLDRTLQRATGLVNTAVSHAEQFGVSRALTLTLLEQAEGLFNDMADVGSATAELRYRKSWMLIEFARNYELLGDSNKQQAKAVEAYQLLAGLAAEKPDDAAYLRDVSTAHAEIGNVLMARGNLPEALKSYRDSLAIRERLAKAKPDETEWQGLLAQSYDSIGELLTTQGNLAEALKVYRDSLAVRMRTAGADPDNSAKQHGLAVSYDRVSLVLWQQHDLPAALEASRASLAIIERLAGSMPGDIFWQRNLSVAYERAGDVLIEQDNASEALDLFRKGLAARELIARAQPENTRWQRDLLLAHQRVGMALAAARNDPSAGLDSLHESLAIAERLVQLDSQNVSWQRDLSIVHFKIADALEASDKLPEALKSYRLCLAINERLVQSDPSNKAYQRDLAELHDRIGDVVATQGNFPEALESFRAGLAVSQGLAASDPDNLGWKRMMALAYRHVALANEELGRIDEALADLRKGRDLMASVIAHSDNDFGLRLELAAKFDRHVDRLEAKARQTAPQ